MPCICGRCGEADDVWRVGEAAFRSKLSPALPRLLADLFPDSLHTQHCGLAEVSDEAVWQFAKREGCAIVTKDGDFRMRSLLEEAPPKVIWLRVGNGPTHAVASILRTNSAVIHTFNESRSEMLLILPLS